jgi:acetyl esterase/lipase
VSGGAGWGAEPVVPRRAVVALLGLPVADGLAGCGWSEDEPAIELTGELVEYGPGTQQVGRLYRPLGRSRGVVVVVHGGFWRAELDYSQAEPVARDLARADWTVWNLEYRRVGNGGGYPRTFDDVAAGLDALAGLDVDTSTVVALGHSAGGHLATWAASRGRLDRWPEVVPVTHVIAAAGVLDLTGAARAGLGGGAAQALVGGGPDDLAYAGRYDRVDPMRLLPVDVPVHVVHSRGDGVIPFAQAAAYVRASRAAGVEASLVEYTGSHSRPMQPRSRAWRQTLTVLDSIVPPLDEEDS